MSVCHFTYFSISAKMFSMPLLIVSMLLVPFIACHFYLYNQINRMSIVCIH